VSTHAKEQTKGAKMADRFYKKLLSMLKRDVPDFEGRLPNFQAMLIGPIAKLILKRDFETKTNG